MSRCLKPVNLFEVLINLIEKSYFVIKFGESHVKSMSYKGNLLKEELILESGLILEKI
jgi:hypothetical protein